MKKITWETKPYYKDSMKHIASCDGRKMCHITSVYSGSTRVGWQIFLPCKIVWFLSIEDYGTLPKVKRRAAHIMRKMAEAFAPLVEVASSDCITCLFCGEKGGKHKETCVSYGGKK